MMHGHEKSDHAIVAGKPTNKAERSAAEPVEPRAEAEGNAGQQSTHRAQYRVRVAQALACIRQAFAVVTRGGNRMRESCTYGTPLWTGFTRWGAAHSSLSPTAMAAIARA